MNDNKKEKILLAYGSEFGNAYDCSRIIFYELYKFFEIDFFCLNNVDIMSLFKYNHIILIVSTTGYGKYPHNMSRFWISLLNNYNNVIFFDNMYFHIFGLGDSAYENYNTVAKQLKKKLKQLEANIVNYSLGNYQHTSMHYANFEMWKKKIYQFLKIGNKRDSTFQINQDIPHIYHVHRSETLEYNNELEERKGKRKTGVIEKMKEKLKDVFKGYMENSNVVENKKYAHFRQDLYFCQKEQFLKLEVLKNERITSDSYFKDARLIDLTTSKKNNGIHVGSLLKVYPFLDEEKTQKILKLLKIDYNEEIIIKSEYINNKNSNWIIPLNQKIKVIDLFVYFIDLEKIVTPFFFFYLSKATNSELHRKKFLQLADTSDISEYFTYIIQDKRSYYDIFEDFFNYINVDIHFLINTLPHIQTRTYSILNSEQSYEYFYEYKPNSYFYRICNNISYPTFSTIMKRLEKKYLLYQIKEVPDYGQNRICGYNTMKNGTKIELLICLYEVEVNKHKKLTGFCSQYLTKLSPGNFIFATIENGLIHLNKNILNLNYRVVYISTGAAFSSLLAVLRHRYTLYKKQKSEFFLFRKRDIAFLGYRQREHEFYFKEELEACLDFNLVYIAFSRDEKSFCFLNEERETQFLASNWAMYMGGNGGNQMLLNNSNEKGLNEKEIVEKKEGSACKYEEMDMGKNLYDHELEKVKKSIKKKKNYITDIILALQSFIYPMLKDENTIFLIAGKSRPFSQNLIKTFANIIKEKEHDKTVAEINEFLKIKIDNLSIILESWY